MSEITTAERLMRISKERSAAQDLREEELRKSTSAQLKDILSNASRETQTATKLLKRSAWILGAIGLMALLVNLSVVWFWRPTKTPKNEILLPDGWKWVGKPEPVPGQTPRMMQFRIQEDRPPQPTK